LPVVEEANKQATRHCSSERERVVRLTTAIHALTPAATLQK
jgi:hypothetical protein